MRFGEHLVAVGVVTEEHLREAVARQAIFGGRIGTNLVQLGHTTLDEVGLQLSQFYQLPLASKAHFENADSDVQKRLPREVAMKFSAVPIWYTETGVVVVGVMEPLTDPAQLQSAIGFPIMQAIAGELRIAYQLEVVYGIMRAQNLLRSDRVTDNKNAHISGAENRRFVKTLSDVDAVEDTRTTNMERPIPDLGDGAIGKIALKRVSRPKGIVETNKPLEGIRDVVSAIRKANERNEIAGLVMSGLELFQEQQLNAAVMWVIRGKVAICWKSFTKHGGDDMTDVALPINEKSLLQTPIETQKPFIGPAMPLTELDKRLFARLADEPKHVLVSPVVVMDQTICVLYGHSSDPFWPEAHEEMAELTKAARLAFQRLIRASER